ncbi:MAG: hypothetical protein HY706_00185 [Candidatus Hydrogenedentes bacterium]|nr:hypothetical protein [Candidatus Hydrogenedentota bacterium]
MANGNTACVGTALYHATRWGALFGGVVTPFVLLEAVICTTAKIARGRAFEGSLAEILASAYAWLTASVSVFAAAFVGALIFEACGLLRRTNLKSDMDPWLKAACWLFMSATIAVFSAAIFVLFMPSARFRLAVETWMAFRNSMSLLDVIVAAALAVCGFILVGWIMGLEKRDYDDWGSLQVDDKGTRGIRMGRSALGLRSV